MKIKFTVEITGEVDGPMPTLGELETFIKKRAISGFLVSNECGPSWTFSIIPESATVQKAEVVK